MLSTPSPFAVIDIGSNSVRMVVYHGLRRVPMPLFNEKYYCGLARDLHATGKLNAEGVKLAKKAIARFALMLERFRINRALVIATAAIRDAKDGGIFVMDLKERFGLDVAIIDGEREAELAAKGIIASIWKPNGLCADLGGGSLELARIENGEIINTQTLPIGTLRLAEQCDSPKHLKKTVEDALKQVDWLDDAPNLNCYAIGGSFRSIAKMHSRQTSYPLRLIHEYHLSHKTIKRLNGELAKMSPNAIASLPGIPGKRAATMTIASSILDTVLTNANCPRATFSVAGIREGVLYEQLDEVTQMQDPLQASAEDLSALAGRRGRYAEELFNWMQPLFPNEAPEYTRLRRALCWLSEIAWTIDPNFRAEWAYLRVLQSDMKGLSHRQRITLATALYHRYQHKWKKDYPETRIIDEQDRLWAHCAGLAANVAFHLSGGQPGNLHHAALKIDKGKPTLKLDSDARPLYTETVEKRLDGLGSSFNAFSNFLK